MRKFKLSSKLRNFLYSTTWCVAAVISPGNFYQALCPSAIASQRVGRPGTMIFFRGRVKVRKNAFFVRAVARLGGSWGHALSEKFVKKCLGNAFKMAKNQKKIFFCLRRLFLSKKSIFCVKNPNFYAHHRRNKKLPRKCF